MNRHSGMLAIDSPPSLSSPGWDANHWHMKGVRDTETEPLGYGHVPDTGRPELKSGLMDQAQLARARNWG